MLNLLLLSPCVLTRGVFSFPAPLSQAHSLCLKKTFAGASFPEIWSHSWVNPSMVQVDRDVRMEVILSKQDHVEPVAHNHVQIIFPLYFNKSIPSKSAHLPLLIMLRTFYQLKFLWGWHEKVGSSRCMPCEKFGYLLYRGILLPQSSCEVSGQVNYIEIVDSWQQCFLGSFRRYIHSWIPVWNCGAENSP